MADHSASSDAKAKTVAASAADGRMMSRERTRIGMGLTALVLLSGAIAWWFTRPMTVPPAEQVTQALKLLDTADFSSARDIAKRLQEQKYRHPGFAGVLVFIQGMAVFGMIESSDSPGDRAQYNMVVENLREAERLALGKDRRPEWCFALGKSLYMQQDTLSARPLLEEARETYTARRLDVWEMLVELYLDPGIRTPELLDDALDLNDDILADDSLDQRRLDAALLQRGEIFLATRRLDEAQNVLRQLSKTTARSQISQILQARILMAQDKYLSYLAAMELLTPLTLNDRIAQAHSAEVRYLLGLITERLSEIDPDEADMAEGAANAAREFYRAEAIRYFDVTVKQYEHTPEATAANLHLGRLWRLQGDQRALDAYGSALSVLKGRRNPDAFRNRWLSLSQFRQSILEAWNGWLEDKRYADSISLSEMMTPLFPLEEAYELIARVQQRWAEAIEDELQGKKFSERQSGLDDLRRQWRQSANAHVRLAEVRLSSSKYPEALWNAADHFRRGHDFERALQFINQFLATEPDRLMAAALVQRSRIELDLDRINEALIDLQQVVRTYPTDPATFTALYLIGVCHFELDQLDEAEAAWQGILTSEQLAPNAVEWRDAQLSLGQLLYQKGDLKRRELFRRTTANVMQTYKDASRDWQEAARLLSRYLDRNQTGQGVVEARYYLGKSLQREAELLGRQLEIAETDNARQQLQSQRDATLFKSLKQFELLKEELTTRQADDQIDELQQRILKNCFFEIPHTWFELRDYDKAISNYNAAINKYPQDVQTLVAYIQMGQCHHRHSPPRPIEARNMLQQAILLLSHKQIPDENFEVPSTNFSSIEWQRWLERARQVD